MLRGLLDMRLMHKILRGMSMVMLQQGLQKRKNGFHRKKGGGEKNLRVEGKKKKKKKKKGVAIGRKGARVSARRKNEGLNVVFMVCQN
jgi:hypothetical protein